MTGNNFSRIRAAEKLRGEPIKTRPEGRRCEECGAKLSIYNQDKICNVCKQRLFPEGRGPLSGGQANKL
jgi:hypothetical protein